MKKNLVFINTHPIQYFVPLYREIEKINFFNQKIIYLTNHGTNSKFDKEFNTKFKWDIPLLEGYNYDFIKNNSLSPGVYNGFFGVVNFSIIKKLYNLKKNTIVVVHGWSPLSCFASIVFSKIFGSKTCLRAETPLSHEIKKSKVKLFFRKIIFKYFLFKMIDKFLFIGKENKKFYKFYGVNEKKLIYTPYSVNNNKFHNLFIDNIEKKNQFKKELGLDLNHKIVLFSGKLISKKNPIDLLKSVISIKNKDLFVVFMGDGILRKKMETIAIENNFTNYKITGFVNQSEVYKYYLISDLFVMCSGIGETWGLSTNEAMNFNLPVVISSLTGCSSNLVDKNGYIFKTGDVKDLSLKIKMFFKNNLELRKEMGLKSKEIISKYSYEKIIKGLKKIL